MHLFPLDECRKEDEGLYVYGSGDTGSQIIYASKDQLNELVDVHPEAFDDIKIKNAVPVVDGLYYVTHLYPNELQFDNLVQANLRAKELRALGLCATLSTGLHCCTVRWKII